MTNMIDLTSTSLRRYARLANKPKQKYFLFAKFSWVVIGSCEVAKDPQIFLTREDQHIQEIHKHFDVILNNFGPMAFEADQEQN